MALKLRRLDTHRMLTTDPPPVPWLVEPLVAEGAMTMLYGREGLGKSLLAMGLAAAVLGGDEIAGMRASRPGRVLYIDAENGEQEIHRRIQGLGVRIEQADRLDVIEAVGFDFRFDMPELEQALTESDPDLLILDSFRTLWRGKENDSDTAGPVVDALRNFSRGRGVACLLLHHTGKQGSDYRGSSAIGAAGELNYHLGRSEGDPDRQRRYLDARKVRLAAETPRRWLRLSSERGLVLIDECDPHEGEDRPVGRPSTIEHELSPAILDRLRIATPGDHVPLADLARSCGRNPKNGSVRRVLDRLCEAGDIEKLHGRGYRLVPSVFVPSPEPSDTAIR